MIYAMPTFSKVSCVGAVPCAKRIQSFNVPTTKKIGLETTALSAVSRARNLAFQAWARSRCSWREGKPPPPALPPEYQPALKVKPPAGLPSDPIPND